MADQPKQRSTEHHGQGQSGYAAGRHARDPSMDTEGGNTGFPNGAQRAEGIDDRFIGRGGRAWTPEDNDDDEPTAKDRD